MKKYRYFLKPILKKIFKVFWCGEVRGGGGVGIVIRKSLCDTVVQVRRVNPRIIGVDFVVGRKVIQVFSVICTTAGKINGGKDRVL